MFLSIFFLPARYRNALDLSGVSESVRKYADNKRWESHNRSRQIHARVNAHREPNSTSDYGSMSETSGSPVAVA